MTQLLFPIVWQIILPLIVTSVAFYVILRLLDQHHIADWSARTIFLTALFFPIWVTFVSSTLMRFTLGMGPVSGMSDAFPWGIWIGFDMLCGVALAAGGFFMAGLVHVFHVERFHDMLRPAILTAFLGYLNVFAEHHEPQQARA